MIPTGIDDGQRIRSSGNGEPGQNGRSAGDLYIDIRLRKHDLFEREGDDLHCDVAVDTPAKLTEHQCKLLKEFDESFKKGGHKHSPNDKSWFEKAKGFSS